MAPPQHPMKALKGTSEGRALMAHIRSHKKKAAPTKTPLDTASRKKMAAAGEAMADGSYPIRNARDLANAYKDWIRTGRSPAVAAHIAARAATLRQTNPISTDKQTATRVAKRRASITPY